MSRRRPRAGFLLVGASAATALSAVYALPVLLYGTFVAHKNWGDFWRTAATPYGASTAGFAALGAGILTYYNGHRQRQQDALHHRLDSIYEGDARLGTRYESAANQLADPRPAIRQAGVYAAAALIDSSIVLADQSGQPELGTGIRQATLDLLCSYLRANRGLAPLDEERKTSASNSTDEEELAVRASVVSVLRDKLRAWRIRDKGLKIDLRGARLRGADLTGADLRGAVLVATNFSGTKLVRADLSHSNLAGANLCGTDLLQARLDGVDLSRVKTNEATRLPN